ncbi:hypothetical protein DL767_008785 [Monosporascus sp. MG133]|nr:hypothetical protein DL767_008785 [Monosporascus sp. MG133]
MDLLMQGEVTNGAKGPTVLHDRPAIQDELFGFFAAGHEAASTTVFWAVKRLTTHQGVQQKLRTSLRLVHKRAYDESGLSTS